MNTPDDLRKELMDLEMRYWNAVKSRDAATAASLTDATCVVVGPQGVGEMDRKALAGMMSGSTHELRGFSLDDVHLCRVSDDVVAIAYRARESLTVEGKPCDMEVFDSSVWVRRDGRWVCAMHTESLKGDPFGRIH